MGGRIVYASRIPPRPHEAQRLGGFDAWRGRYSEKLRILVGLEEKMLRRIGGLEGLEKLNMVR